MDTKIKRVLNALGKKLAGTHPTKKEMCRIARDGLYSRVEIVGLHENGEPFDEGSEFSYYQYIEFVFTSPVSSTVFVLSSLPWDDVVSEARAHGHEIDPMNAVDVEDIDEECSA